MAFGPVCHFMLNKELKEELSGHYYNQTDEVVKTCLSAPAWEWHYCPTRYLRLTEKLKDIPSTYRMRYNRNIYEYVTSHVGPLLELVSEAASLFIKGMSSNPISQQL